MARRHFMPGPTKFQSFVWKGRRRLQQTDLEGFEARERVTGICCPLIRGVLQTSDRFCNPFLCRMIVATTGPIISTDHYWPSCVNRSAIA